MTAYLEIGADVFRLEGAVTATKVNNGLQQFSIPTTDGLGEVSWGAINGVPKTLVFHVHAFSSDENEIRSDPAMSALLGIPNALVICPHLFGSAGQPNTCGSPAQLAHMLDVINWAKSTYGITDVWMAGISGGAGLGPTFIGAYPGIVSRASFWAGYNDLASWYGESVATGHVYNQLMDQTFGGGPSTHAAAYLAQSPKGTLPGARNCVIYINDGLLDTDIPPHHRQDMRDALLSLPASANVTCNYIAYPGMGHAVDWPIAISQLLA